MKHKRKDGRSLLEDFRCETVIFLNNAYMFEEKLSRFGTVSKCLIEELREEKKG